MEGSLSKRAKARPFLNLLSGGESPWAGQEPAVEVETGTNKAENMGGHKGVTEEL